MEILINELSLSGQFASAEQFVTNALPPLVALLNEVDYTTNLLYKKYDLYSCPVAEKISIHDILIGTISRQYDEVRKFKSQLANLFENPYWEESQKHLTDCRYLYNGKNICRQSMAEACERDKIIISFTHPEFSSTQLFVTKEQEEIILDNLSRKGHYTKIAWMRGTISFEDYCRKNFAGSKLDFSQIDNKDGFSLLKKDDENLFFDGFRKFAEIPWEKIPMDDGLDYKEYNNKNYFKTIPHQIRKFRISEKYRCFGYVEQGIFYVLLFDLEHKLSDKG